MENLSRNFFDIDNAKNLTVSQLVDTFVSIDTFWMLFSRKHHILLGSRGSGKTALVKMISHQHLSKLNDPRAKEIIKSKEFIGIYMDTNVSWVGSLKNKQWLSEAEGEKFFQWRFNLSICLRLLDTLKSCLDTYIINSIVRFEKEKEIVNKLSRQWSNNTFITDTISSLAIYLDDLSLERDIIEEKLYQSLQITDDEKSLGICFNVELFKPLKNAIKYISQVLEIPDTSVWLMCIDEAEYLEEFHHRILNTHLRSYTGNLFFKITTMPYSHYTLKTNLKVDLTIGHDFDYLSIDEDPTIANWERGRKCIEFASSIYNKRADIASNKKYGNVDLGKLFGESILIDPKIIPSTSDKVFWKLLNEHANRKTLIRAYKLKYSQERFSNEIYRKINGALILKDRIKYLDKDKLDIYSGLSLLVRCSDGNPRYLIQLFSLYFRKIKDRDMCSGKNRARVIRPVWQTLWLKSHSHSFLNNAKSEREIGPDLYKMLETLGNYFSNELHQKKLSTDLCLSIMIDPNINRYHNISLEKVCKGAVEKGYLIPHKLSKPSSPGDFKYGIYHLAYLLSPHFNLLPRKGKAINIINILRDYRTQIPLF